MVRDDWFRTATKDPGTFRLESMLLRRHVRGLFEMEMYQEAYAWSDELRKARAFCRTASMLHTWAFQTAQLLNFRAIHAIYAGDYQLAARDIQRVTRAIAAMEIKWPENRWTSVRLGRDNALGALKWLAPEGYKDFMGTAQEAGQAWIESEAHINRLAEEDPDRIAGIRDDLFNSSAAAGINVIKAAARYAPAAAAVLIEFHNQHYHWNLPTDSRRVTCHKSVHWGPWEVAAALEAERRAPALDLLDEYYEYCLSAREGFENENQRLCYVRLVTDEARLVRARAAMRSPLKVLPASQTCVHGLIRQDIAAGRPAASAGHASDSSRKVGAEVTAAISLRERGVDALRVAAEMVGGADAVPGARGVCSLAGDGGEAQAE